MSASPCSAATAPRGILWLPFSGGDGSGSGVQVGKGVTFKGTGEGLGTQGAEVGVGGKGVALAVGASAGAAVGAAVGVTVAVASAVGLGSVAVGTVIAPSPRTMLSVEAAVRFAASRNWT